MQQVDIDRLEQMIDDYSLSVLLDDLANICRAKAGHIQANYDDAAVARTWAEVAKRIEAVTGVAP